MNRLATFIRILQSLVFLAAACSTQIPPLNREECDVTEVFCESFWGKAATDKIVADFVLRYNCNLVVQFELCEDIGVALWIDKDQVVKAIWLYSGISDSFGRYRGELPFGISFYDPLWRVQEKLRDPDSSNALVQAGLPDETASPDHMHYWAMYKRLSMTVIYNSPGIDEDAYIYAILISQ